MNDNDKPIDEELLAHTRICISKLTSDFKSASQVCPTYFHVKCFQKMAQLESGSGDFEKRIETAQKELAETKLQLQQAEVKNKNLQETMNEQEKAKRQLENELDSLNVRLASAGGGAGGPASDEAQKLITQLRDQIAEKNAQIDKLKESLQELQLVKDKLSQDYEKLKNEEGEKEKRLKDLSALSDKREQAKQDLKGKPRHIYRIYFNNPHGGLFFIPPPRVRDY